MFSHHTSPAFIIGTKVQALVWIWRSKQHLPNNSISNNSNHKCNNIKCIMVPILHRMRHRVQILQMAITNGITIQFKLAQDVVQRIIASLNLYSCHRDRPFHSLSFFPRYPSLRNIRQPSVEPISMNFLTN